MMYINGRKIDTSGKMSNIVISNGDVFVNGQSVDLAEFGDTKVFSIVIEGNVENVENISGDVTVNGSVGSVTTTSGDIVAEDSIIGNVKTISGDVKVNGSIGGNVNTISGDIKSR